MSERDMSDIGSVREGRWGVREDGKRPVVRENGGKWAAASRERAVPQAVRNRYEGEREERIGDEM